jgi:repressor LexA
MTDTQRDTFLAIREHFDQHGYPPTRAELARVFGVNPNAIQCRLKAMAKKRFIALVPGTARGIKITWFG